MEDERVFGTTSRRSFITGAAATVAASFLASCSSSAESDTEETAEDTGADETPETIIKKGFCRGQCANGCYYDMHIRDGQIVRVTAADMPIENYRGICPKGLTQHCRVYSPDRLQYPMKRVGERGEGKFERISWDEAIDTIVEKWKEAIEKDGPGSWVIMAGGGNEATIGGYTGIGNATDRLRNVTGAANVPLCVDGAKGLATGFMIGSDHLFGGNSFTLLDQAKTIICWGTNPAVSNIQDMHWLLQCKDQGIRYIVIDPVYGPNASKADLYIPINASTDGALALGILNVIFEEGKEDKEFCRAHTNSTYLVKDEDGLFLRIGILGVEPAEGDSDPTTGEPTKIDPIAVWDEDDGKAKPFDDAKSPALDGVTNVNGISVKTVYMIVKEKTAEYTLEKTTEITGVPAETIQELAHIYEDGPVTTLTLYGMDHYVNGHYNYVDMFTLSLMTQNVGRPGAMMARGFDFPLTIANMTGCLFPTDKDGNPCPGAGPTYVTNKFNEILDTSKYGDADAPFNGLFLTGHGFVSTGANRPRIIEALKKIPFIVVCDIWMTETVSYADIVLPNCSWFEHTEILGAWQYHPYLLYQEPVIEPLYESKGSFEIYKLLTEKLGCGEYFDMTEDEYVELWLDTDEARRLGISLETLKENGPMNFMPKEEFISGEGGIFATPDTRAALYKESPVSDFPQGDVEIDASKELTVYWEPSQEADVHSPVREEFPFHAMNEHVRTRNHTQWFGIGQLQEYYPEPYARLNPEDADELGIEEGDTIKIYNDRGYVTMKATITGGYPRKMIGIPRGHMNHEFIDGHFCNISNDQFNQCCANQPFSDQAVAIEEL